ncbi:transporter substrate-binding domain-containing protein, partial [Janibacter melonis]|uniref:transporter substrate-binding domain-containing protein n=1 Tax=Janibacter melonis TaxID=262209 RepID=UPI001785E3CA|nr:hypothetical protein [Janibacter melonis]
MPVTTPRPAPGPLAARLRVLAALLLALLPALVLAAPAGAQTDAEQRPTARQMAQQAEIPDPLRVGTEGVYAPFSIRKGDEFTGFDIEVMDAVAERLGVEVEYVPTQWDSMFAALDAGRFDVVANQVTSNPEREQLYDLSDPYVETGGGPLLPPGPPGRIVGPAGTAWRTTASGAPRPAAAGAQAVV